MNIRTINPATEEIIKEYKEDSSNEVLRKIDESHKRYIFWKKLTIVDRVKYFEKLVDLMEEKVSEFANLMTTEMGKPIIQSVSEIEKCLAVCKYYVENAEKQLKRHNILTEMAESYVVFQPLGVIFSIMPWNFPFWQVFRFVVPAVIAGNTVLLKHSPNTTGVGITIEKLFLESGFPTGVLNNIILSQESVPEVSKQIVESKLISAVTFTGSSAAGAKVSSIAGNNLKKSVMELGGSDPYIVFKDADLDATVAACVTGRLINSGQSCIAAKRFIVDSKIYEDFLNKFTTEMQNKKLGNPNDENVFVGPLARKDLRLNLHSQVEKSIELGAKNILGCSIPEGKGFYYPVSILDNVKPGMPAFDEELFGPVASVIKFDTFEEAISLANSSIYGLGGAVFSKDLNFARMVAETMIDSGTVQINDFVRSDPRLPFGGIKQSGYGRELSEYGIKEFVNIKTVSIK